MFNYLHMRDEMVVEGFGTAAVLALLSHDPNDDDDDDDDDVVVIK